MKATKSTIRGVYVPRMYFVHPETKHRIVFQGAMHVASGRFYRNFLHDAHKFDGEVHIEGVKENETIDMGDLPLNDLYVLMARSLNSTSQKDYVSRELILNNSEKFKNHDLVMDADFYENIVKLFKDEKFNELFDSIDLENPNFTTRLAMRGFNIFGTVLFMSGLVGASSKKTGNLTKNFIKANDKFIIEERNIHATAKAMESQKDVLLFWGSAHLTGMKEILEANGYEKTGKTEWRRALPLFNRKKYA